MEYSLVSSKGSIVETSDNLIYLVNKSNQDIGSTVINDEGRVVHMSMKDKVSEISYKTGQKVTLKNVKVYKKNSLVPHKITNGIFYIYDGTPTMNGRYAIVDSYTYIGLDPKHIYGYINQHDIN